MKIDEKHSDGMDQNMKSHNSEGKYAHKSGAKKTMI